MPSPRTPGGQKGWSKAGGQICTNAQKSSVRQKHLRSRQQVDVGSGILTIYCRFPDTLVCPGRDPQSRSGQMTLDRSENLQELQIRHRPLWHATATGPCLQLVDFRHPCAGPLPSTWCMASMDGVVKGGSMPLAAPLLGLWEGRCRGSARGRLQSSCTERNVRLASAC